uniref:Cytochrome P450 n=1 Tax=Chenopodium quinoa TaxID=63459 RepID=A0A803MCU1_CHEQI
MSKAETNLWPFWLNSSNRTNENWLNIFTIIVPLFFVSWFIFSIKRQSKKKLPQPPGPRGLPLVGYLPFLDSNLHHSFINLASIYGPIFKVQLGMKDCSVVTSPSLIKEVLRDKDVIFANRGDPIVVARSIYFGSMDIGFSDYGREWRKMRKIFVGEMMSNARLDASFDLRKQHVKKMMYEIYRKAGQQVDIGELTFVTIGIERRVKMISSRCEAMFDSAINHHNMGDTNKQKDFLGHLLQLTKIEDPATSLTLPQVKAMLMDTLIGGSDTTVAMVEWTMAEVLQHAQVMRKVQEELAEIVGLDSTVEEVHLPKLKYLNAVAKESLRLHPPVPLLVPHCASEPSTIGGYSIPKGVRVFLHVYSIQRDPHIWEDPLLFKPERFLSGSATEKLDYLGNQFQYLPFGSGRRMCPGVSLAERTAMLVLASLLHAFQWKLPYGSVNIDTSERFGLVVKKAKPLLAIPSLRLSSLELYSCKD